MGIRFAGRLDRLPVYPLAEIPQIKRRLIQQGVDVIDVGAGDADFPPPDVAVEALARAARDPAMSRYGFQLGLPAFREAAAAYMERRFGQRFDPFAELHPVIGSKEGIAHLAMAVMERGDVAVVPDPGYAVYAGGTILADAEVHGYPLRAEQDFLLELEEVPADVLARTRLVYLNYPNNPTAAVAPRRVSRAHRGVVPSPRHRPSYIPPVQIGEVMRAGAVGQVVESRSPDYKVGDFLQGTFGWQDYATVARGGVMPAAVLPKGVPLTWPLGVCGITGLTAYFGLLDLGKPKAGEPSWSRARPARPAPSRARSRSCRAAA